MPDFLRNFNFFFFFWNKLELTDYVIIFLVECFPEERFIRFEFVEHDEHEDGHQSGQKGVELENTFEDHFVG